MPAQSLFVYGSLRDRELLSIVIGRPATALSVRPAKLHNHDSFYAKGESFPMVAPAQGAVLEGDLVADVSGAEMARIAFYEDDLEFELRQVEVETDRGPEMVGCWFALPIHSADRPWRYTDWLATGRDMMVESARETMWLYEQNAADWDDKLLWSGIQNRARAKIRAHRWPSPSVMANLTRDQVDEKARLFPYASLFAIEELHLSHPTFSGGMTPEIKRVVFSSGDAVTVLPYDPRLDAVLLISQWRAGPHARGDQNPWPVEVIAGRVDTNETSENVARREAEEEAGLNIGRMEQCAAFYASPGVLAEHVTSFVAEADLSKAGGVMGLEGEVEDILSKVVSFDDAMEMADNMSANSSPSMISLLWLARHRERLRREWAGL